MAIKAELINQYLGFGNGLDPVPGEYFYSRGGTRTRNGLTFGRILSGGLTMPSGAPALTSVQHILIGRGRREDQTVEDMVFVLDAGQSTLFQYRSNGVIEYAYKFFGGPNGESATYKDRTNYVNFTGNGAIVDQKNRLLYASAQFIGKFDGPNGVQNYTNGTVSVTNGSTSVTGTGTAWVNDGTFNTKAFRIVGENKFYYVSSVGSNTSLTLSEPYQGTTGSGKSYIIYRAWDDDWKDTGSAGYTYPYTPTSFIPMELYEDLVLIGKGNHILTLNTANSDSITTHSSPAFTMPEGFWCFDIKANATGILMAFNRSGRSVLVLWDGFSDRAISPWVQIDDNVIGLARYGSGWMVLTTRNIYYTNGYQLEPFAEDFLGSEVNWLEGGTPMNTLTIGNDLWMSFKGSNSLYNIRDAGLYRMNLKTKLVEFYGTSGDLRTGSVNALLYPAKQAGVLGQFPRMFVSSGTDLSILGTVEDVHNSATYSYITNPIGEGETMKTALAIRLPIAISEWKRIPTGGTVSFTITAKIATVDDHLFINNEVLPGSQTATSIQTDETYSKPAEVGHEIEFKTGVHSGKIRTITNITGSGTSTATYTFDSLGSPPANGEQFTLSRFKIIERKTYSGISNIPKEIYFNIQNQPRGKKFMVKFVVENATVPLEIRPFLFIYDDSGEIV
jgi:hypothetical protein